MTLLNSEGFDWLQDSDLPSAYGAFGFSYGGSVPSMTVPSGRTGQALRIQIASGQNGDQLFRQGGVHLSTGSGIADGAEGIFGFAWMYDRHTVIADDLVVASVLGSKGASLPSMFLVKDGSGVLKAGYTTSTGSTVLPTVFGSGTTVLAVDTWYYIEVKYVPDASAGSIEVRVNGVSEFSVSGIRTISDTNDDSWGSVKLGNNNTDNTTMVSHFDDFYLCDNLGSNNNDFLGDIQIQTLKPNGNGTTSQFTGSDGNSVDNYLLVDDGGAIDDDTTYVEETTAAQKDTYAYENTTGIGTVYGVNVKTIGKKVGGGAPDLLVVARSGGTESDSTDIALGTDYHMRPVIYEQDPNGPTNWTAGSVDAAEFGVKLS